MDFLTRPGARGQQVKNIRKSLFKTPGDVQAPKKRGSLHCNSSGGQKLSTSSQLGKTFGWELVLVPPPNSCFVPETEEAT